MFRDVVVVADANRPFRHELVRPGQPAPKAAIENEKFAPLIDCRACLVEGSRRFSGLHDDRGVG